MEKNAYSYNLKNPDGSWLGQVAITDDGLFAACTDYGNATYIWRSFGVNFKGFLATIGAEYFAEKISMDMMNAAGGRNKKIYTYCNKFTEHILPALQAVLKKELAESAIQNPKSEIV
jgi:hypothetical protein